jgi:hypothetical protein
MSDQMELPDKVGRLQDGTFPPGVSGNPSGRPKGSRHKASIAVDTLLDGQAEALTQKAVELALTGDTTALRLCLERIAPARKSRPIRLELPTIENAEDVAAAMSAVVSSVASGDIDTDEGTALAGIIEIKRRSIETLEMDARLRFLEASIGGKKP